MPIMSQMNKNKKCSRVKQYRLLSIMKDKNYQKINYYALLLITKIWKWPKRCDRPSQFWSSSSSSSDGGRRGNPWPSTDVAGGCGCRDTDASSYNSSSSSAAGAAAGGDVGLTGAGSLSLGTTGCFLGAGSTGGLDGSRNAGCFSLLHDK